MGIEVLAKKIDLVVMTGSVPFITAGIFQEDHTEATLISGALSGMSNMFQEMLQQGELRHSELYNAHVYIRHLSQINDNLGLISPEIKHSSQMRVAVIVREGELSREQELALSELCYSIMVMICQKPKLAKKLVKGNVEGYIPTNKETIEILAEAISDYRKRARKSTFYENINFLQEKDRFITLPIDDELLENQIEQFCHWIKEKNYPEFFPKLAFKQFFGKKEYWSGINVLTNTFTRNFKETNYKEKVSTALFQYILQGGLMPLIQYSGNILDKIESFYKTQLPLLFNSFIVNLLIIRGPIGISIRGIDAILSKIGVDDDRKIGWNFLRNYLVEIGDRPFELPFLKQFCKILSQFNLQEEFLSCIYNTSNGIVPSEYIDEFITIVNTNLSKPIDLDTLKPEKIPQISSQESKLTTKQAPGIPKTISIEMTETEKKSTKKKSKKKKLVDVDLPKASPECSLIKNSILIQSIANTFSWVHNHLFGQISLGAKNTPTISTDGLLFYNLSESLAIEIGLTFNLIQSFSGPRTWLIGQLSRIIDSVEDKLHSFEPESKIKYKPEKKITIDIKHVNEHFRKTADKIITIISQIETDASKGKITKENKKSYLETGFLGRIQEISIPQIRKHLEQMKSINKNMSNKELENISKASAVNYSGLTTNITSLQLLAIPLPHKESDYSKEMRESLSQFKKWSIDFNDVLETMFRVNFEIKDSTNQNIHENILNQFIRSSLTESINKKFEEFTNSDLERKELVRLSFQFKNDLFTLIGDRLLYNKLLSIFTTIPLSKPADEKSYLYSYLPIKPPIISEEIKKFFILTEDSEENEIIGRVYTYQPFNNDHINNLTELLLSDAFRRAYASVEVGLKKIVTMGKKIHSGTSNLVDQLMESYHLICNKLSITQSTN
ncbi:MAG: hypothetical protein HZR80_06905 [Candidatus Heimdallarchaeota archaeon]